MEETARLSSGAASQRVLGGHLPGIDDPRLAELVDQHPESLRPERRLKRHLDLAVLRKSIEDAFSLGGVVELGGHTESGWLRELSRRRVGSLQHLIADLQGDVHDAAMCLRWRDGCH